LRSSNHRESKIVAFVGLVIKISPLYRRVTSSRSAAPGRTRTMETQSKEWTLRAEESEGVMRVSQVSR